MCVVFFFLPIDEQCKRKNKQLKPEERENIEKEKENKRERTKANRIIFLDYINQNPLQNRVY